MVSAYLLVHTLSGKGLAEFYHCGSSGTLLLNGPNFKDSGMLFKKKHRSKKQGRYGAANATS